MPFLLAEILNFQGSTHHIGVGSFSKLFFMTGLYLGSAWEILFYLILSCLLGLGFAALRKTQKLPFGPSIAAACFIMIVYGDVMTRWYTGLF